jgi:hypothetical protein
MDDRKDGPLPSGTAYFPPRSLRRPRRQFPLARAVLLHPFSICVFAQPALHGAFDPPLTPMTLEQAHQSMFRDCAECHDAGRRCSKYSFPQPFTITGMFDVSLVQSAVSPNNPVATPRRMARRPSQRSRQLRVLATVARECRGLLWKAAHYRPVVSCCQVSVE